MAKPILISGIQPTGRLHLGNYLGALKNFVTLQNSDKYQCYFFIADLHALTENPGAKDLSKHIVSLAADFLAAGLDPKKSVIFQQSQIDALQDLKWILSSLTPVGELMRMTAFKEKVLQALRPGEQGGISKEEFEKVAEESNFGLAEYPVLMAADILIYGGQFVPVGKDQLQHLEFARTLVRKFNSKFGKTFVEPREILSQSPRVMSLDDPTKKMSKSRPAGCLFIDDSPAEIEKKIRSAVTDSGSGVKYDPQNKAAISNLLMIYSELSGLTIPEVEAEFNGKGYADFKKRLAEVVIEYFEPFRAKKSALLGLSLRGAQRRGNLTKLKKILADGSQKAHEIAKKKMLEVKKRVGLTL